MTPAEFRRLGHEVVDWVADYREKLPSLPVMSPVTPGSVRARLPASPPASPEAFDAVIRDLEQILLPGLSHWQHPSFFGYFPSNGELSSVLGRLPEHRTRGAGAFLAEQPGAHGARGSGHGLDAPDGGPVRGLERRHPGHRLHVHARGPHLCARAHVGVFPGPGRPSGRGRAPRGLRLRPQPQLGGEGGAPRRLRTRPRPLCRHRRALRDASGRTGGGALGGPRGRSPALRGRGDDRHHHHDRPRSRWRRSRARPAPTACGCTWTRRWRARP